MKTTGFITLLAISLAFLFSSCGNSEKKKTEEASLSFVEYQIPEEEVLQSHYLTAEEQAKLTPQKVLEILKEGNFDFVEDNLTIRNTSKRVREAVMGQYPMAVILSCLDSRVPVEDIFHCGIGDLFVARVAGNVVDEDMLGSMEYACKVSGSKLVLVLGHGHCGAIKSAVDDVKLGNITTLLSKIRPAVRNAEKIYQGEHTSSDKKFVDEVCRENVLLGIENVRTKSPILKEMEDNGEILILGGIYNMESGTVEFIEN